MKRPALFLINAALLLAAHPLRADDPPALSLTVATDGAWETAWQGVEGITYFMQWSPDLVHWQYLPMVQADGGSHTFGGAPNVAPTFFVRLRSSDQATLDPAGDTFDTDTLSNWDEVNIHHTDPFLSDTDGDGMPDDFEVANQLNPNDPADAAQDPDQDGLINLYEWYYRTAPHNLDSDGDTLTDGAEVNIYHTSPLLSDSDYDGLSDSEEVLIYGTDPLGWDTDADTLADGDEINVYFTNPLAMDTDGDWMWDDYEIRPTLDPTNSADGLIDADGDGLLNQFEFVFLDQGYDPFVPNDATAFPWSEDPDCDGLSTLAEFDTYHTNPRQPDTDMDTFDDGWEVLFGFDPLVSNLMVGPANQRPEADPDGDGVINGQEAAIGTNPNEFDTDGDGVSDGIEDAQGSNPNDPSDKTAPPNGTASVTVTFGDPSASHSEKYRVILTPLEGDTGGLRQRTNRNYGQTQADIFHLPKGARYKVELSHVSTAPNYRDTPRPDFDYTLEIQQLPPESDTVRIVKDPQQITGVHNESGEFFASGKSADLFVMKFETTTEATTPTNWERKKLGVGEVVDIEVSPLGAGAIAWSLDAQQDSSIVATNNYKPLFTAASVDCEPKVIADFGDGVLHAINFQVVSPSGERSRKDRDMDLADLNITAQEQGAGMQLTITLLPDDVSFQFLEVRELPGPASNCTGYFDPLVNPGIATAGSTSHVPKAEWHAVDDSNRYGDAAGFSKWPKILVNSNQQWIPGHYAWDIPMRWRLPGNASECSLPNRIQEHEITGNNGASKETKLGQSATRTPTP